MVPRWAEKYYPPKAARNELLSVKHARKRLACPPILVKILSYYRIRTGLDREVQTCVAKNFIDLVFCALIPLHPGNEQGLYYSVGNARLALTCSAAFRFLTSRAVSLRIPGNP